MKALILFSLFLLVRDHSSAAELSGRVLRLGSSEPVPGALVLLSDGRELLADVDGKFSALVGEGVTLTAKAAAAGFAQASARPVTPGVEAVLRLAALSFEAGAVKVVGRRLPRQQSEQRLSAEESRRVPGAAGDVVRAITALPGAVAANDFLANLLVRGGGFEDNLILLDGFPVAYPFHFGGLESVFHSGLIESATFLPGAFDARFGDALGGVLDLRTRPAPGGAKGEVGLSMILASALARFGSEGWGVQGAYRRGYFDLVLDPNSSLTGIPRYQDYHLGAQGPALGGLASLRLFGSLDELRVLTDASAVKNNPSLSGESRWNSSFHTLGAAWERRLGNWTTTLRGSGSMAQVQLDLSSDLKLDRRPYEWLALVDIDGWVGDEHHVNSGAQWHQTRTQLSGYFARLPVEFGSGFDFESLQKVSVTALGSKAVTSAWAQDHWQLLPLAAVDLGARFDQVDLSGEFHFSPRLGLEVKPWQGGALRGALGDYFQSPNGMETVPGWTSVPARSSLVHAYSGSFQQALPQGVELRVEAYHKDFERRIPPVIVGTTSTATLVINAANTGYSEGAEILLRLPAEGRYFGWLSYAWNNTLRGSGFTGYYEADFSQPHVLNVVANARLTPSWEVGARYRWGSGIPYTPVASRSFDSASMRWTPRFAATNSARLPNYQRLDLRLQYSFLFDAFTWRSYLEVFNSMDNENVTSFTYEDDYSDIRRIKQFPRFYYVGTELEF